MDIKSRYQDVIKVHNYVKLQFFSLITNLTRKREPLQVRSEKKAISLDNVT